MAHIMTKDGSQQNIKTYEHICDTIADRDNIEEQYITLGTIALVLHGATGSMEFYIADSQKQWLSLIVNDSESSSL